MIDSPAFSPNEGSGPGVSRETPQAPAPTAALDVSRETSPTPASSIIIAVINQKGGVGKTTSAVNLSASLALKGYRALLLDLDPQGNAATSLGIDRYAEGIATSHDLLLSPQDHPQPVSLGTNKPDLYPGSVSLIRADIDLLALGERRDFVLRDALASLAPAEPYDFIIIDSPPSLGILTLNILIASHHVLIPIQCEYLALEGLTMLLETLEEIRRAHNPALSVLGCLITMSDLRTNLSQQVVADVRTHLGERVFNTMIPRTVRLSECPSHGQSIFDYDRWGAGARSYDALTREILTRLGLPEKKRSAS
ncbi:MAG: chromosome partitioning protein [Candidatus Sumerlaeota bacterium]|nr:chromosome partitioning protein [Candidatus Sumerlaeota bacterium]